MDQKQGSGVNQELLEPLSNQIGSKAEKSSENLKQRLWILGTFISLLVVVVVVASLNQTCISKEPPSFDEDLDYYVYEDYAHSDQDNEYIYDDYALIGGNSREDADITNVRRPPPPLLIDIILISTFISVPMDGEFRRGNHFWMGSLLRR